MCGILATQGLARSFHHSMLSSLRRRGPDAVGFWCDRNVNIGHTRLAILGLDERGTQPIENEKHVLAYNGEIYNFNEIKQTLAGRGIRMTGTSDCEVLLHAWTTWGPDVLTKLTGFWAFAVYEKASGKITLVRDQLGIKPLYYWNQGGRTCVASMIRTILEVMGESPGSGL